MEPILNVKNLTMTFGGLKAIDNVNISIEKGQIAALIGPNGAGKTTFFNCNFINGLFPSSSFELYIFFMYFFFILAVLVVGKFQKDESQYRS